jgi:hypothetical protein
VTFDGPMPTITTEEALSSDRLRLIRDIEIAAWCGMDYDELGPFLDRLHIFDIRTRAAQEAEALERARALARERQRVMRWGNVDGSRYGLAALTRMLHALGQHDTPSEEIERVAYQCGRLTAGEELSPAVVVRSLVTAMDRLGLPEDVYLPVVQAAVERGARRPKSAPTRVAA